MGRTGAAASLELFPKRVAGTMEAYAHVGGAQSELCGDGGGVAFLEVHVSEHLRVFGLEGRHQVVQALAHDVAQFGIEAIRFLASVLLLRAAFSVPPPVVVDEGVAKNAVEPGDGALVVAQLGGMLETACECGLEQVLGDGAASHPALQERKKLAVL